MWLWVFILVKSCFGGGVGVGVSGVSGRLEAAAGCQRGGSGMAAGWQWDGSGVAAGRVSPFFREYP